MRVINGSNVKTPNHFGCMSCAIKAGSEIPIYREFSLRREVHKMRDYGMTVDYDRHMYQCNTCGHLMMTPDQAEDFIENREFARHQLEIDKEFGRNDH